MALYEKRTYSITVGGMADVVRLYTSEGWPVLAAAGFDQHLVGYFISDTGPLHQLIHVWRFDDDSARRAFWQRIVAHQEFRTFWAQVQPLVQAQEVQLWVSAPWGPQP
jgi:hypothetical protein